MHKFTSNRAVRFACPPLWGKQSEAYTCTVVHSRASPPHTTFPHVYLMVGCLVYPKGRFGNWVKPQTTHYWRDTHTTCPEAALNAQPLQGLLVLIPDEFVNSEGGVTF